MPKKVRTSNSIVKPLDEPIKFIECTGADVVSSPLGSDLNLRTADLLGLTQALSLPSPEWYSPAPMTKTAPSTHTFNLNPVASNPNAQRNWVGFTLDVNVTNQEALRSQGNFALELYSEKAKWNNGSIGNTQFVINAEEGQSIHIDYLISLRQGGRPRLAPAYADSNSGGTPPRNGVILNGLPTSDYTVFFHIMNLAGSRALELLARAYHQLTTKPPSRHKRSIEKPPVR